MQGGIEHTGRRRQNTPIWSSPMVPVRAANEPARGRPPIERSAVFLCAEEDDLSPALVSLIDRAVRRGLAVEVVVLEGTDPMPPIAAKYPRATFVVLRSDALGPADCARLRTAFNAFRRPGQHMREAELHPSHDARQRTLVDSLAEHLEDVPRDAGVYSYTRQATSGRTR